MTSSGYKYVVESVCLDLRDGSLVRDVKKRDHFNFEIR